MKLLRRSTSTSTKVPQPTYLGITNQLLLKKLNEADHNEAREDFARRARAILERYHQSNDQLRAEIVDLHMKQH